MQRARHTVLKAAALVAFVAGTLAIAAPAHATPPPESGLALPFTTLVNRKSGSLDVNPSSRWDLHPRGEGFSTSRWNPSIDGPGPVPRPLKQAEGLSSLGDAHEAAGHHDTARKAWSQAADIRAGLNAAPDGAAD